MNELTKCRLCQKSYELSGLSKVQNDPKTISCLLPILLTGCGHTFCNSCVLNNILVHFQPQQQYIHRRLDPNYGTQQQQRQQLIILKCPTCCTTTACEDTNHLPINYAVVELLRRQHCNNSFNTSDVSTLEFARNDFDARENNQIYNVHERPHLFSQRNQITGRYKPVSWRVCHQENIDHKALSSNENKNKSILNKLTLNQHDATSNENISASSGCHFRNFPENGSICPDENDNKRRSRSFSCAPYQLNDDDQRIRNIVDEGGERTIADKIYPDILNDRKSHRLSFLRSNSTSDLYDDVILRPPPYNPQFLVHESTRNNNQNNNNNTFNTNNTCINTNTNNSYIKKQSTSTKNNSKATILPSLPPLSTNLLHCSLENLTDAEVGNQQILRFNKRLNTLPTNAFQQANSHSIDQSDSSRINSRRHFQPSTMYKARLSQIIENETDMLAPTKLALSSAADFVTLVDQPANAVHVVSIKLNQRHSIKVPGVTGCCFISDSVLAVTTSKSVRIYTVLGELKREMDLKASSCVIGCIAMDNRQFAVICSKGLEIYKEESFCCSFVRSIKCKMMFEKGLAFSKKTKLIEPKMKKKIMSKSSPVEFSNLVDVYWSNRMFAMYETHRNETVILKKKNAKHNNPESNSQEQTLKKFITLVDDEFGLVYSSLDLTTNSNPTNNNNDDFFEPYSVALSKNGTLFVSDRCKGCVFKYANIQGKFSSKADDEKSITCIGTSGSQKTQIFGIVLNDDLNQLYVVVRVGETVEIRVLNV